MPTVRGPVPERLLDFANVDLVASHLLADGDHSVVAEIVPGIEPPLSPRGLHLLLGLHDLRSLLGSAQFAPGVAFQLPVALDGGGPYAVAQAMTVRELLSPIDTPDTSC
jgi:hypothetical protein